MVSPNIQKQKIWYCFYCMIVYNLKVYSLQQFIGSCNAWTATPNSKVKVTGQLLKPKNAKIRCHLRMLVSSSSSTSPTGTHAENACFLPLQSLGQDYLAPRIIQIAGAYPGLSKVDFEAVTSEPAPVPGQWSYDFSDPNGPQMGTVALQGGKVVTECQDPVVVISDHLTLGIRLPPALTKPVDLIVLVDRAQRLFEERKFMVIRLPPADELLIRAYPNKSDFLLDGAEILGRVVMVQIPWLPAMKPTKSGFQEDDELYTG